MNDESKERKETPVFSGVINYFPDAIREIARVSFIGNEQHNPGSALHWDRSKSGDELDALARHLIDAGTLDSDGTRHSAKVAWRALANLQKELEREAQENWEERIVVESIEEDEEYFDEMERRMNIIGQNGNEGLHYDESKTPISDYPESNLEYVTDEDGKGAVNYSNSYPGDIKITYDEI